MPRVTKMLNNLKIFNAASARMEHASLRHSLIASNIAHADTPNYVGKDLKNFTLEGDSVRMRATRMTHLNITQTLDPYSGLKDPVKQSAFDETLNQNKISIEEEMAKATEAQASHNFSSSIWRKSMNLFMSVIDTRR